MPGVPSRAAGARALLPAALTLLAACRERPVPGALQAVSLAPPVADSLAAPQLMPDRDGGLRLSWLAPRHPAGWALRTAAWHGGTWGEVATVVADDSVFMHPTDLPSVTRLSGGELAAVWQRRVRLPTSNDPWQYEFRVQLSADEGRTWSPPVIPHPGSRRGGEHEFSAAWPAADGSLGLVWIDPRAQKVLPPATPGGDATDRGAMMLMTSHVSPQGEVTGEAAIDSVMCECCPNSVALTAAGPVVAYRDKRVPAGLPAESLHYAMNVLRDLSLARLEPARDGRAARWVAGQRLTEDNWIFNGCPNNGPALDARGGEVVVAWWTGEGDAPRVQVRFSSDTGRTFAVPIRVDDGRPVGQVTTALVGAGALVGWLDGDSVRVRHVARDGTRGPQLTLGAAGGRHRLPRMVRLAGDSVVAGWVGPGGRLALALVTPAAAPAPPTLVAQAAATPPPGGEPPPDATLGALDVLGAYVVAPADTTRADAYLVLRNRGSVADTLVDLLSCLSARTRLSDDRRSATAHAHGLGTGHPLAILAPGARLVLGPGRRHVVLEELGRPLRPGDVVTLALTFRRAGVLVVPVPVLAADAPPPGG